MSKTGLINLPCLCEATFQYRFLFWTLLCLLLKLRSHFFYNTFIIPVYTVILLMGWILGIESKDIGSCNLINLHHWFRSCLRQRGSKPFAMMYVAMDEIEREVNSILLNLKTLYFAPTCLWVDGNSELSLEKIKAMKDVFIMCFEDIFRSYHHLRIFQWIWLMKMGSFTHDLK